MAESTLSIDYDDIAAAVGYELGYTGTSTNWSAAELAQINLLIQTGYRQFLYPPHVTIGGRAITHAWTFLEPVTTIYIWKSDTAVATGTYPGSVGTVTATTNAFYPSMVGATITFGASSTEYTISGYTSATVVTVTADPQGEAAGDTITITPAVAGDFPLPDDFGSMRGNMTFAAADGYAPCMLSSEYTIREARQYNQVTSRPTICAVRPKAFDATTGQRYELMTFPSPAESHTMTYAYTVLVSQLDGTNKYPIGGTVHGDTVLASCLAVAESRVNDAKGVRWDNFMSRLYASVSRDREDAVPEHLGLNRGDAGAWGSRTPYRDNFRFQDGGNSVSYSP